MLHISIVRSNVPNLCPLLNVVEEQQFLEQFMSPEAVKECIQGGDTNMAMVKILCEKVIADITAGSMKMYDALCEYFLKRIEAYQTIHQCFTAVESTNSKSNSSDVNSELHFLQEKVKTLTEEVLHWRQAHAALALRQSEFMDIKQLLTVMKSEKRMNESTINDDTSTPRSSHVTKIPRKPRLTDEEKLQFTYEGLPPVEANAAGTYPPFHWQDKDLLSRWADIVQNENSLQILPFPPLLLNDEIIDKTPIVIFGGRMRNEFVFLGGFHAEVPKSVLALNVQLELSLCFTKKDNTKWTVDKQIIATIGHGHDDGEHDFLFVLYDVPFTSFSSSSAPVATNISIRRIWQEQKWFYWGLAPRLDRNGKYGTIHCNALHGSVDCAQEWKSMVENQIGCLITLPPLLLMSQIWKDVAVCMNGTRNGSRLEFYAALHPSTRENVETCEVILQMNFQATSTREETVKYNADYKVTVKRVSTLVVSFVNIPWRTLSADSPPRISLSLLQPN